MVARISSRQPREISGSFGQEEPLGRRRAFVILRESAATTMTLHEHRAMGVVEHLPGHGIAQAVGARNWKRDPGGWCVAPGTGQGVYNNII